MRKSTAALFAAALIGAASQASASQVGWCSMSGPYDHHYESGLIEIADGLDGYLAFRDGHFKDQFYRYILDSVDKKASWQGCSRKDTYKAAKEDWARSVSANPTIKFHFTGWTGSLPPAVDRGGQKKDGASGPFLTIENTNPPRKPIDDEVLKAQREAAGALAKRIADTARRESLIQAQFKKFMEELRKRGSAQ